MLSHSTREQVALLPSWPLEALIFRALILGQVILLPVARSSHQAMGQLPLELPPGGMASELGG